MIGRSSFYNIVLVMEDQRDLVSMSIHLGEGYRIFTAGNEQGLMSTVDRHPIHLVIARLRSGSYDGALLCARIKSSPRHAHIPVLLIVPDHVTSARLQCLEAGADAFLEQSLFRDFLSASADNLIANRARTMASQPHPFAETPIPGTPMAPRETFQTKLDRHIADNLSNINFDVDVLARLMNMSRPTLYRKIKDISPLTPNELINNKRLQRAAELIACANYHYSINEIARMVGFNSRSNFGKAFFKQFRVTPTRFRSRHRLPLKQY